MHLRSTVVNQADANVNKGLVIKSNPAEGNNVAANTLVTLYVSTGVAPVAVPDVEGKQESAASTTLQNDGFTVSIQQDTTSTQPSGTVVNQSPTGGTKVTTRIQGHHLRLRRDGRAERRRPAPGQRADVAAERGLQGERADGNGPAGTAPGTVWQQNPGGSSTAAPGSSVTIIVQPQAATPSAVPDPDPDPDSQSDRQRRPASF